MNVDGMFRETVGSITCFFAYVPAPVVMQTSTASNIFAAVERMVPEASVEAISTLAARLRIVTIAEVPDNCNSVKRMRNFKALRFPQNVLSTPHGSHEACWNVFFALR